MVLLLSLTSVVLHGTAAATTTPAEKAGDRPGKYDQYAKRIDLPANSLERQPVSFNNPDRTIEVGLHVENMHQLSLKDKIYWVEGWYWLKWTPQIQQIMEAKKIPLTEVVEFTNEVEGVGSSVSLDSAEPVSLPDGRSYQLFRFSNKFYVNDLNLKKYPFVEINLPVTLETRQDALSCYEGGPKCVDLKPFPDNAKTVIGQFAEINGFDLIGASVKPYLHQYNTTFGVGKNSAFGAVDFDLIYKTNYLAVFGQYILPLLVVIGIVLVSPSLPGSIGDVRLAIPTTALLTMIFLQQGYRADIPSLSYFSFLDWLYMYAYVVSICFFILFAWGTYRYNTAIEDQKPQTERSIDRIDTIVQTIALLALVTIIPMAWFFA